jgi:hypothetical protein
VDVYGWVARFFLERGACEEEGGGGVRERSGSGGRGRSCQPICIAYMYSAIKDHESKIKAREQRPEHRRRLKPSTRGVQSPKPKTQDPRRE